MDFPPSTPATHHDDLLVVFEDGVAVDHADDGHAQVTPDTKGDTEADAREDGDDVAPGQAEAGAVHHGHLLLRHRLRPAPRRQLHGLAIVLLLLKSSVQKGLETCTLLEFGIQVSPRGPVPEGHSVD